MIDHLPLFVILSSLILPIFLLAFFITFYNSFHLRTLMILHKICSLSIRNIGNDIRFLERYSFAFTNSLPQIK